MYLCEMIFAILCLYFIQIDIGYECIVFSCVVKINVLLPATADQNTRYNNQINWFKTKNSKTFPILTTTVAKNLTEKAYI